MEREEVDEYLNSLATASFQIFQCAQNLLAMGSSRQGENEFRNELFSLSSYADGIQYIVTGLCPELLLPGEVQPKKEDVLNKKLI